MAEHKIGLSEDVVLTDAQAPNTSSENLHFRILRLIEKLNLERHQAQAGNVTETDVV